MLVAISGSVNCELNFGKVDGEYTNFGCQLTGTWNHLGAYVTEGKGFQYTIELFLELKIFQSMNQSYEFPGLSITKRLHINIVLVKFLL